MAVKGLTMRAIRGQVAVLLGHNGCGKSTTFLMISGMIQAMPTVRHPSIDIKFSHCRVKFHYYNYFLKELDKKMNHVRNKLEKQKMINKNLLKEIKKEQDKSENMSASLQMAKPAMDEVLNREAQNLKNETKRKRRWEKVLQNEQSDFFFGKMSEEEAKKYAESFDWKFDEIDYFNTHGNVEEAGDFGENGEEKEEGDARMMELEANVLECERRKCIAEARAEIEGECPVDEIDHPIAFRFPHRRENQNRPIPPQ